jgi:hypothetical protein
MLIVFYLLMGPEMLGWIVVMIAIASILGPLFWPLYLIVLIGAAIYSAWRSRQDERRQKSVEEDEKGSRDAWAQYHAERKRNELRTYDSDDPIWRSNYE